MCELFAMSSLHPATVRMSLEEFSRHGGLSGPHKDGWGIAWYEDHDIRLFRDTFPSANSACVHFIQENPFVASTVMSHIRKATLGRVALCNCQPIIRELGGTWHCFAHNGHLAGIEEISALRIGAFRPVGETDSEYAFCALLERFRPLWMGDKPPEFAERIRILKAFAAELRAIGPSNFLYSDGDLLVAHSDRRHQQDGSIRPPGLWRLQRHCKGNSELASTGLYMEAHGHLRNEIVLFASVPLTAEEWVPLAQGELMVAHHGQLLT